MGCDIPAHLVQTEADFIVINEGTVFAGLAREFYMDWDANGDSEIIVARKYISLLTLSQSKSLKSNVLKFLSNTNDAELVTEWVSMGAHGWLNKTNLRTFLEQVLLEANSGE